MKKSFIIISTLTMLFAFISLLLMTLYLCGVIGQDAQWVILGMASVGLFIIGSIVIFGFGVSLAIERGYLKIKW